MAGRLAGKVALISGGARGMGASHAREMVAHGDAVGTATEHLRHGIDVDRTPSGRAHARPEGAVAAGVCAHSPSTSGWASRSG